MAFDIVTERQRASIAVAIVFLLLPTIAVSLRLLARRVQRTSLTPSDYCIFGALICDWAICSLAMVNVFDGGVGTHQDKVSLDAIKTFLSSLFAIELLWAAAEGLIKTSMCLLYMQIFELRWFRIASYVTIAICNAFALMVILSTTFICIPVRMSFDPTVKGHCGNRNTLWLTIGVFNILTDLLVVALPLPVLWHLQIPRNKKLGLMVIFSFGLFVCVVSCIRLQYLLAVDFEGDMSYTVANAVIWSLLEPTLAVTIGCLPTIFPLLRRWFPSFGTSNRSAKTGSMRLDTVDAASRKGGARDAESQAYISAHKHDGSRTNFSHGGYIHKTSSEASTDVPDNGINVMTEWVVTTDEHHIVHPRPGV